MGKSTATKRDVFFRSAKEEGFRARSAYKLIHLDEEFNLFEGVNKVVDLCAAPGSWLQVLSTKLNEKRLKTATPATIIGVDLQAIASLPGVITIEGDITSSLVSDEIISHFKGGLADLVVCDGAPDGMLLCSDWVNNNLGKPTKEIDDKLVTGLHDLDEFVQAQLLLAALNITLQILRPNGVFVAKIFTGKDVTLLYDQLRCFFTRVTCAKPRSSRGSSMEAFVVCEGFRSGMTSEIVQVELGRSKEEVEREMKVILPFISSGDLSGFDGKTEYPTMTQSSSKTIPVPTGIPFR